jgi:hypothetical protein
LDQVPALLILRHCAADDKAASSPERRTRGLPAHFARSLCVTIWEAIFPLFAPDA